MNHIRGTDGWFRSMLVLEVGTETVCLSQEEWRGVLISPIENFVFLGQSL
jgi:hypothetical protein